MYVMLRWRRYWQQQVPERGPFRVMAAGVLVTTAGEGAWYTSWAIYFTTVAGLRAAAVGVGLVIAGAVGLAAATPVSALADRLGPRDLLVFLVTVDGLSMAAFTLVRSFWLFVLVSVINTAADRASTGVKTAYVAGLSSPTTRIAQLARQRVASHVGYTLGAAAGAICLSIDTTAAFAALIGVNALTSLGYAGLLTRLPIVRGGPPAAARASSSIVHDRAFLAVVTSTGALSLCWGLVSTGLPLWLIRDTRLPTALAGVVIIINSLGIALLQVTASRGCGTARRASVRAVWSGGALAVACLLLASTRNAGGVLAGGVVIVAAVAHLAGELWFIASKWGLTLDLTPEGRTGQYQGAAATAQAAAQMISPAVMTVLIGSWGQPGWLVLAALFSVSGLTAIPATRWAIRTRPVPVTAAQPSR
jgi:hypothetical protein